MKNSSTPAGTTTGMKAFSDAMNRADFSLRQMMGLSTNHHNIEDTKMAKPYILTTLWTHGDGCGWSPFSSKSFATHDAAEAYIRKHQDQRAKLSNRDVLIDFRYTIGHYNGEDDRPHKEYGINDGWK